MSLLSELNLILDSMNIPVETGAFSGSPPEYYAVLTPITDAFGFFADNIPQNNIEEVRISLFDKGNYNEKKNKLVKLLLRSDISVTDRRYIGREDNTGYYHYAIDVAKNYDIKEKL